MLSDEVSDAWNGVSVSATGFGLILGVILLPTIHRRIGAGSAAVLGVVLMAGSLFALSQVDNFWVLFVFRVLLGVGANLMFVVTETGLNALSDPKSRGQLLGLYSMVWLLSELFPDLTRKPAKPKRRTQVGSRRGPGSWMGH